VNSRSDQRKTLALVAAGAAALFLGLAITWLDVKWLTVGLLGLVAVGWVFRDYRVGVVCLTMLMPWSFSTLLPQTYGFNLINFIVLASVVSLGIQRTFGARGIVHLPKVVWWCYLLPIAVGVVVAWPHLPQGIANFPPLASGEPSLFAPQNFLKTVIAKPLFFVLYALLLANAVRDSNVPRRFFIPYAISALLSAGVIIADVLINGGSVTDRSTFLLDLGMHPNEYGMQLALAAGPLLFLTVGSSSRWARLLWGVAFACVSLALLLTGSRGAALSYLIVLAVWLLHRRKFTDLLWIAALVAVLLVSVPESFRERLTLGLDDIGSASVHKDDDELTKGRFASWALLAPEILDSPVWGQGVGATAWNAATTSGRYGASHPHNMYLEILLDVGVLGFLALMYLYYRYARAFRLLSRDSQVSPIERDFFHGALASLLGMAAMAMTNGHWMPHPEQAFLWFALGFAYAYWSLTQPVRERMSQIFPATSKRSSELLSRQHGASSRS